MQFEPYTSNLKTFLASEGIWGPKQPIKVLFDVGIEPSSTPNKCSQCRRSMIFQAWLRGYEASEIRIHFGSFDYRRRQSRSYRYSN